MNKIDWTNANHGMPFGTDVFKHMHDSYINSFNGILDGIKTGSGDAFIVSGCVMSNSGGGFAFTPGYVCINGELCAFAGALLGIPSFGTYWRWSISVTLDTPRLFFDGNSFPIRITRTAVIITGAAPPYTFGETMMDRIGEAIGAKDKWHQPDTTGEPPLFNGYFSVDANRRIQFIKGRRDLVNDSATGFTPLGRVKMRGLANKTGVFTPGEHIFTFPAGYRPGNTETFACVHQDGVVAAIKVQTDGQVFYQDAVTVTSAFLSFSNVQFIAEQ